MELRDLLAEQSQRLYGYLLGQLRNHYDAEDALSETVLIAIQRYPSLREADKALGWLFGIARNVARRWRQRNEALPLPSGEAADTVPLLETLLQAEEYGAIRRALSTLAKDYRQVLVARYVEEQSYRQIAGSLSIPVSLVSYRVNTGRRLLKEAYLNMDTYMEKGYYQPRDLAVDISYVSSGGNRQEQSRRAMDSLLAKNIALVCYQEPRTVMEISRRLGVPADYIEDAITKMLRGQCPEQRSNRYQTAFPILTADMLRRIKALALEHSKKIYEAVLAALRTRSRLLMEAIPNEKQAVYFLWCMMDTGEPGPYDKDFDYPCRDGGDRWVVKAHEPGGEERSFPLQIWQLTSAVEAYDAMVNCCFEINTDPHWSTLPEIPDGYQTVYELAEGLAPTSAEAVAALEKAGIVDKDRRLCCLCVSLGGQMEGFHALAAPVAALERDMLQAAKDQLSRQVKALFPKRFDNLEPYINCEIRNMITIGFEEYLLREDACQPLSYVSFDPIRHGDATDAIGAAGAAETYCY